MTKDVASSLLEPLPLPSLLSIFSRDTGREQQRQELCSSMVGSPSHGSPATSGKDKPGWLPPFPEPTLDWEKLLSPGYRRPESSAWSLCRELSRPNASVCFCQLLSMLSAPISGHAPPTGNGAEAQSSAAFSSLPGPPWQGWDAREPRVWAWTR